MTFEGSSSKKRRRSVYRQELEEAYEVARDPSDKSLIELDMVQLLEHSETGTLRRSLLRFYRFGDRLSNCEVHRIIAIFDFVGWNVSVLRKACEISAWNKRAERDALNIANILTLGRNHGQVATDEFDIVIQLVNEIQAYFRNGPSQAHEEGVAVEAGEGVDAGRKGIPAEGPGWVEREFQLNKAGEAAEGGWGLPFKIIIIRKQ